MNRQSGIHVLILVFIGIFAVATVVYFLFIRKTNPNQLPITPVPTELTPIAKLDNLQFNSQKLGVSFDYAKAPNPSSTQQVKTLEEGNKVYVYVDNGTDPHTGQWVEVFQKNPTQTLTDAIKQRFLATYPDKNCFIRTQITYPDAVALPSGYEVAEITFPTVTDTQAPWWENSAKCPPVYTTTNGISYFLMDTRYPNKYAYFSIGQYGIPAGTDNPQELWQDTFRFVK